MLVRSGIVWSGTRRALSLTDRKQCGRLEHGFLQVRCADCHAQRLVAVSCKRRGFCPSGGARRMAEGAALLLDQVLPREWMRQ